MLPNLSLSPKQVVDTSSRRPPKVSEMLGLDMFSKASGTIYADSQQESLTWTSTHMVDTQKPLSHFPHFRMNPGLPHNMTSPSAEPSENLAYNGPATYLIRTQDPFCYPTALNRVGFLPPTPWFESGLFLFTSTTCQGLTSFLGHVRL